MVRCFTALHPPQQHRPEHHVVPARHERQHPRLWVAVRVTAGVWLLALTALLYAYGVGGWWAALLVPAGALHLYWAFLLHRGASDGNSR